MAAIPQVHGRVVELPRVLSSTFGAQVGLSRSAVRHAVAQHGWQRLVPGMVLTAPDGPTREDWAMVGLNLGSRSAALSGWDAVRMLGIGAHTPPTEEVLVLDRHGRHRRVGGVWIRPTVRQYDSQSLSEFHPRLPGAAVVTPARAIADTALAHCSLTPVRAMVTASIQRRLCTPDGLAAELASMPRNGSALFRRSLVDVLDNAHSVAEAEAVDWLRAECVPGFEVNVPFVDAHGQVIWVADLFWRGLRAIAEIDSVEFHFSENDWKATGRRHNLLTGCGLAVQHYPPSQIRTERAAWARRVDVWLRARAVELGVVDLPRPGVIRPGPDGPEPYLLRP